MDSTFGEQMAMGGLLIPGVVVLPKFDKRASVKFAVRSISIAYFIGRYKQQSASRGIRGALDALQLLGNASNFGLREQIEFNRR
jgi:hypothetical protein